MKLSQVLLGFVFCISLMGSLCQAQVADQKKKCMELLTGGNYRQWKLLGSTSNLGAKSCEGDEMVITFYKKQGQMIIKSCQDRVWNTSKLSFSIDLEGEEFLVLMVESIGKIPLYMLDESVEACKGNSSCIRLSIPAETADMYSKDYYFTL